jgi:biotin carboxylase
MLVPLTVFAVQFIGPTSSVMAALGDKVSANILAQTAKVPSIPWSGQGIECELNEEVRRRSVLSVCACMCSSLRWESGCCT